MYVAHKFCKRHPLSTYCSISYGSYTWFDRYVHVSKFKTTPLCHKSCPSTSLIPQNTNEAVMSTHVSPSIAVLAAMYNFPPIPAPAPVFPEPGCSPEFNDINHYQDGIIMVGRHLTEVFRPECPNCTLHSSSQLRKPIPGWTDGSTAWRAVVYGFRAPINDRRGSKADKPHTIHNSGHRTDPHPPSPYKPANETAELYDKYSRLFRRRSQTSIPPRKFRERSILKPGAEGKLLVPDVKLRMHGGSSPLLGSPWSPTRNSSDNNMQKTTVESMPCLTVLSTWLTDELTSLLVVICQFKDVSCHATSSEKNKIYREASRRWKTCGC